MNYQQPLTGQKELTYNFQHSHQGAYYWISFPVGFDGDRWKHSRPVGLMDKASASGAGDSRFESWAGQFAGIRQACICNPVPRLGLTLAQILCCLCGAHSSSEILILAAAFKKTKKNLVRAPRGIPDQPPRSQSAEPGTQQFSKPRWPRRPPPPTPYSVRPIARECPKPSSSPKDDSVGPGIIKTP